MRAAMPPGKCRAMMPPALPLGVTATAPCSSSDAFPPDSWTVHSHSEMPTCLAGRKGGACTPRLKPYAVSAHGTPPQPAPRPHCNATAMALFLPRLWCPINPPWPPGPAPLPRGGSSSVHPEPVTPHTTGGLEEGRHVPGQ